MQVRDNNNESNKSENPLSNFSWPFKTELEYSFGCKLVEVRGLVYQIEQGSWLLGTDVLLSVNQLQSYWVTL